MSLQIIDVGSIANDNTGEPLRNAFVKVNENFSELYTQVLGTGANLIIAGNALEATNTNGNVELVPNGSGVVKLSNVVVDGAQIRCSPIGTLTLDTTTAINNLNVTGGFSVAGASNLGAVTNITITGGVAGYALTTNGSGTLSWSPAALIAGATGTADRLAYFPTTGSNIADTSANLTWTGNNLLTVTGNISTGNIIAGNLTVGADKIVSAGTTITIDPSSAGPGGTVIIEGNLQVTGTTTTVNSTTVEVSDLNLTLAKDAATAAAANGAGITVAGASATLTYANTGDKWVFNKPVEVTGSLTGTTTLSITGNANVGNLGTAGLITATGNITGGNLNTNGVLAVTGNATVGNVSATNANVSAITATGNANVGNLGTVGLITASGNITGGNLNTSGILSVTGNATVGNISATNANVSAITATGNANVGNIGATQGVFTGNITAGNINGVSGILSVTGNANLGNLGAGAGVFTGVVTVTGNLSGGNISTLGVLSVTGNANVGNLGATAAVLAGPLSGVTTINASGNANVGNLGATNSVVTANATFGNINSVSGILNVTGNATVGNLGATAAVLAGPISGITTLNASGNANVGNLGATNSVITANATFGNINGVSGILSVTGNANVGNIGATAAVLAGPLSGATTISASGNANVGNIEATRGVFTTMAGNLETTAQPNITVVGTLTGLTVSGNISAQANVFVTSNIIAGNINSVSGILNVTGNANVGNLGATAAVLAGPISGITTLNASGNANVGNLGAAQGVFTSNVNVTGNVSAGNISSLGTLGVTGNANVGNLGVAGLITTTSNITGANITSNNNISTNNLVVTAQSDLGNVGNVRITGGSTDYVLRTDGAGNLSWISVPVISGSVATGTGSRLAYYATTGQTVSDTGANLTWNGGNLLTVTGTITADNLTGNITTGAQPNITSVGTLTSLTVTGNASAGNLNTTGLLSVSGNANVGNLGATNIVGTLATNAQPNITSVGNLIALNAGLTNITASTDSTSTTSGALVVAGGVGIGGNLHVGAADKAHIITGNVTITGNITVTGNQNIIGSNNISYTDNILELHNQANSAPWTTDDGKDVGIRVHYYKGADKHAFFGWSNDAQSLEYYYDGTESGGVFSGSYGTIKGNVFHSTATTGTAPFTVNSTTQVANLNAALAGTVTGNIQANITAVGTLSSLTVSGNITANANVLVTSNITAGNINGVSGILSVTGNANVGNIGAIRGVFSNIAGTLETAAQPSVTSVGTLTSLTVSGGTALATSSGNVGIGTASPAVKFDVQGGRSYFTPLSEPFAIYLRYNSANAGVFLGSPSTDAFQISKSSGAAVFNIDANGNVGVGNAAPTDKLRVEGTLSATGNANVGNIGATRGVFTNVSGTLETAAQTNITSVGTLGSLTVSGNATFDTNTLFVDSANNEVGIGTTSPLAILNTNVGTITGPAVTPGLMLTSFYSGVTAVNSIDWNYSGQSTSPVRLGATFNGDGAGMEMVFYTSTSYTTTGSERMRLNKDGNLGIGTSSPGSKLTVSGDIGTSGNIFLLGQSTAEQYIKVGYNRSGSGYSYIDLIGDTTYAPGTRLIRGNTGANAISSLEHRGTGDLRITTYEAAPICFYTSSSEKVRIDSSGSLLVGTTSSLAKLTAAGGTASGAVGLITSGQTGTTVRSNSVFRIQSEASGRDVYMQFSDNVTNATEIGMISGSTYFCTGALERMRIDSSGNVGIGVTPSLGKLHVVNNSDTTLAYYLISKNDGGSADGFQIVDDRGFAGVNSGKTFRVVTRNDGTNDTGAIASFETVGGSSSTRMRINIDGNVGIGNSAPAHTLSITGTLNVSGNATFDTNTLFVDSVNDRIGIGTTAPSTKLHVVGGSLDGITIGDGSSAPTLVINGGNTGANGPVIFGKGAGSNEWLITSLRGVTGTGDLGMVDYVYGANPRVFYINASERMRIDSGGNLLISTSTARAFINGVVTPLAQVEGTGSNSSLSIVRNSNGTSYSRLFLGKSRGTAVGGTTAVQSGDGVGEIQFTGTDGTSFRETALITAYVDGTVSTGVMPGRLVFFTGSSAGTTPERMRIDSSGYLLVGYTTSNGAYNLQVNSQIFATNATIATSDRRYKENISDLESGLSLISKLKPVIFDWRPHEVHNFDKGTQIGFIAQQVQEALADTTYLESIVKKNEIELKDGTKEEFYGLSDSKLIPLLVKAIQELKAEIDILKARN